MAGHDPAMHASASEGTTGVDARAKRKLDG